MTPILRNDDAEAMILDIRAGRNAATQDVGDRAGAFLIFPTSVVTRNRRGGQLVYPLGSDAEPGALVSAPGTTEVSGTVAGVTVTGAFNWAMGEGAPAPASYRFRRRGCDLPAPPWAGQLPSSQELACAGTVTLARQQNRLRRRGRDAEHRLLSLTERVLQQSCRGPMQRTLRYRTAIDADDVAQRGLQVACRLLPLYASRGRPPCSWLGMIQLDGRRDMHREVSRLDGLPADVAAALLLADACGVKRHDDPSTTLIELAAGAEKLGRPLPRIGAPVLDAALRAVGLMARETVVGATVAGPEADGFPDDQGGPVTATVARLVTEDAELIALAAAGDPGALRQVGDRVVCRLSECYESPRRARGRCWEEFQQSGQLFCTPLGLERFRAVADPDSLAAVDECLRRAAGVPLRSRNR